MRRLVLPLLIPALALAVPTEGETLPDVAITDLDGKPRTLPDRKVPVVVIYEDANAGDQNPRAGDLVDRTTDLAVNRGKIEALAVADLGKWNWWPAKKFALAEVKKIAEKEQTVIWADWTAAVRKKWRLTKGKSGIVVVGTDGRVRFVAEGPLSDADLARLGAAMASVGATIVPGVARGAEVKHAAPEVPDRKPPPGTVQE